MTGCPMRWPRPLLSSASLSPRAYDAFPTAHQEGRHTTPSISQGPPPFSSLSPSEPHPDSWSIMRCVCVPTWTGLGLRVCICRMGCCQSAREGWVVMSLSVLRGERVCV